MVNCHINSPAVLSRAEEHARIDQIGVWVDPAGSLDIWMSEKFDCAGCRTPARPAHSIVTVLTVVCPLCA